MQAYSKKTLKHQWTHTLQIHRSVSRFISCEEESSRHTARNAIDARTDSASVASERHRLSMYYTACV